MADANGDGIDDTTGQPVPGAGYNPSFSGQAGPVSGPATASFGTAPMSAGMSAEPLISFGFHKAKGTVSTDAPRSGPGGQGGGYDGHVLTQAREQRLLTASQALMMFDSFSRDDFLHFRNLFIAAGLVGEGADPMSVRDAYAGLLGQIAEMQAAGAPVTPQGYVNNLIRMNGLDPSKVGSDADFTLKQDAALEPWKKTQRSVYDLSPEDARATLEDTMTKMLGRAPSEDEIHDFINAAQTAARKHPTTATATFTPGDTGLEGESSSSVTKGGVTTQTDASGTTVIRQNEGFSAEDIARMAEERAKHAPDYAGYQAISTYYPALVSMLGASTGA